MIILLTVSSQAGSISQLITVILIFALVLAITAFTTRYLGNYQKMQSMNRNMEVIETIRVANNKYLQIVRACDKYVVIGVGKDEISKITEIDADELIKVSAEKGSVKESFSEIFSKTGMMNRKDNEKSNDNE